MGILFEGITSTSFLAWLVFIGVLILLNEITRRSLKASILVFCILPVVLAGGVLLGYLGSPTGKTWFGWVKVISALIGVYGFLLIRFTKLGKNKFAIIFPGTILALNIAEAVYREFQVFFTINSLTTDAGGILIQGGLWNVFNGLAGVLCILTLTGFVGITVSKDASKDMVWPDMTWLYIVGYTLWNFAYVYNCISTRAMYAGAGILIAALISELFFKKGVWLQHRAQILSMYAMFSLTVDFQSVSYFKILPTYDTKILMIMSVFAFVFNVFVFVLILKEILKNKKNPLKGEIFNHTKYYKKSIQENNL
jgi:hypothetical protein